MEEGKKEHPGEGMATAGRVRRGNNRSSHIFMKKEWQLVAGSCTVVERKTFASFPCRFPAFAWQGNVIGEALSSGHELD